MPERIQRQRTKGWRMPPGAVYVGRPSRWANPFIVGREVLLSPLWSARPVFVRDRAHAVRRYRAWLLSSRVRVEGLIPALGGRDLACWCPLDQPCHADVLIELANAPKEVASA